ncbi:MFS transporter [Candidatus Poriferisocius sp.]|uniref:MFS transporter n=1 Tax=Candidatus Poriferisocius sp. TaxID=3101276 RepID=UPI003B0171F9
MSRRVLGTDVADEALNGPGGLLTPRSDMVLERLAEDGTDQLAGGQLAINQPAGDQLDGKREMGCGEAVFVAVEGPVDHYLRTVTVEPLGRDQVVVIERFDYRLAVPVWQVLFDIPFRRALCRGREWPWWHPPVRFNARQARVVALLAILAVIAGFLGTLIGQTITFARQEFGFSKSAEGVALGLIRLSILVTVVVAALGDRQGRRRTLLLAAAGSITAAVATAPALGLGMLVATQAVSRGLSHAMALLVLVFAMEESPAGARAYVASMLALAAGLGSGLVVGFLPLADLGTSGWRLVFLTALAGLPLVAYVARHLPESRRFEVVRRQPRTQRPPEHRSRLGLLAVTSFAALVFSTPASQLQNDFLRDDRGFSATRITMFTLLTAWTAGPGMLFAGKLADLRGRRVIGALGSAGGALLILWHFTQTGWPMWVVFAGGACLGAATIPSLGVYRAELFGTAHRSESNGLLGVASVAGSAAGLAAAGFMADAWGYGTAFSVLVAGPILVALVVILFYPDTARRSLEDLNPDDKPDDK